MLPTTFRSIWPSCFRVEDFQKSTNQKQELPVVAMFVNGSGSNEQPLQRTLHKCFLPSFRSFGKTISEEKIFQKSTNQKQELFVVAMFVNGSELNKQTLQRTLQGCFLPSFGSFGKAASEEKIFQKSTNQKQELLVTMFVNGSELNEQYLQRTYQTVSEEKIFQKSTNQKQELPVVAMFDNGSGRNEQSLQRTFHRCFLPSFNSFGQTVSEEKIKM